MKCFLVERNCKMTPRVSQAPQSSDSAVLKSENGFLDVEFCDSVVLATPQSFDSAVWQALQSFDSVVLQAGL